MGMKASDVIPHLDFTTMAKGKKDALKKKMLAHKKNLEKAIAAIDKGLAAIDKSSKK